MSGPQSPSCVGRRASPGITEPWSTSLSLVSLRPSPAIINGVGTLNNCEHPRLCSLIRSHKSLGEGHFIAKDLRSHGQVLQLEKMLARRPVALPGVPGVRVGRDHGRVVILGFATVLGDKT